MQYLHEVFLLRVAALPRRAVTRTAPEGLPGLEVLPLLLLVVLSVPLDVVLLVHDLVVEGVVVLLLLLGKVAAGVQRIGTRIKLYKIRLISAESL